MRFTSVVGEGAECGDDFGGGGDDLVFEGVGEGEGDAFGGDAADGGVEEFEAFVGDYGGDGGAPAALVGVFLDDEQPGGFADGVENGGHVEGDEAAQVDDLGAEAGRC